MTFIVSSSGMPMYALRILSCRGKPDKMVDVFFDACDDVELDESRRRQLCFAGGTQG